RLTIEDAKASPVISNIEVYHAPKILVEPEIRRDKNGAVSIQVFDEGLDIFYTIDGTEPSVNASRYDGDFSWKEKGVVKAVAVDTFTGDESPVAMETLDVVKEKWKIVGELHSGDHSENIFDGNAQTSWIINQAPPADVIIDLGEQLSLTGFTYLPDQSRGKQGLIYNYELFVSPDDRNWGTPASKGEFSNIHNSPV